MTNLETKLPVNKKIINYEKIYTIIGFSINCFLSNK